MEIASMTGQARVRLFTTMLVSFAFLGVRGVEAQEDPAQIHQAQVHVIEIIADKDSRYKSPDGGKPEITLKAGEQVLLRVSARKAKSWNRDGSIHGFTLLRAADRTKVQGWNLLLRPGQQEFQLTAPAEPGQYVVVCTVICSSDHEGMNMRLLVVP
jgi:heme/copper-type cytochrome/quinol oxidase subunit 2